MTGSVGQSVGGKGRWGGAYKYLLREEEEGDKEV